MDPIDLEGMEEGLPLQSATDNLIIMHRECHFGGSFKVMLDYYNHKGKGVCLDFTIEQIEALQDIEERAKQNLAGVLLSGAEAEKVARAKKAYQNLRDLYQKRELKSSYPLLIADLILSEDEEAQQEVNAIIKEKDAIVPSLLELLCAHEFYDPLFPGYGEAPTLAAKCLGLIGNKRAIIGLFESIGQGDFFEDDVILKALKQIGEPAKQFLLKVVKGRPITEDNERAAIALVQLGKDPEVANACLQLLQNEEVLEDVPLATYLVLGCEGLESPADRETFLAMTKKKTVPKNLKKDIEAIAHEWKAP